MKIDSVDIVHLLREVQTINNSVKVLSEVQVDMASRLQSMEQHNEKLPPNDNIANPQDNTHSAAKSMQKHSLSADALPPARADDIPQHDDSDKSSISSLSVASFTSFETVSEASMVHAEDPREVDISANEMSRRLRPSKHRSRTPSPHSSPQDHNTIRGSGTGTGLRASRHHQMRKPVQQKQNLKDGIVFGSGSGTGLRAAAPRSQAHRQDTTQTVITGIFVTRLDPKTAVHQVQSLVKRETGLEVRPEKLQPKFGTYSSFYIRGDRRLQDTLLCGEMWPKGTLVKRYAEKVR